MRYIFQGIHNLVFIQSISDTMKIGGLMAYIFILFFMILIAHQSFAYYEYEPNAQNSKIEIDINVNFNKNGSKTIEKTPGNLQFKI